MNLKKLVMGLAVLGLLAMPAVTMAGVDLNVNMGGDNQAHFDFNGGARHHNPMIWKAAVKLREAKAILWHARFDFHGHKMDAIGAINAALDQLSRCEQDN